MQSFTRSKSEALFEALYASIDQKFSGYDLAALSRFKHDPAGFGEQVLGDTYTDEVKQLMESVRDNRITIAKSANAVGKTFAAARIAVWWHKVYGGKSKVFTAAAPPEDNLKTILWGEIGSIVVNHPKLFANDQITTMKIVSSPENFIQGVSIPASGTRAEREAKFAGKHAPYLLFIVDEGDGCPDEIFRGIESCMSGGEVRLLIMFNPRAESGPVYLMERDNLANVVHLSAFSHPNVMTGEDKIPGAVTRETTVRRINLWCRHLAYDEKPDSECFELPPFLIGATAKDANNRPYKPLKAGFYKIMEPAFAYMVLGQYPGQGSAQLISKEWISKARSRWDAYVAEHGEKPPEGTAAIMGLDVAELGGDSNCACFRYGGYVAQLVSWGGVDTVSTGDRAAELYKGSAVYSCQCDGTGLGAGIAPQMRRAGCSATSVKVASKPTTKTEMGEFQILRDQLWWACREWLRTDPGAMLPPNEKLLEELAVPAYEVIGGKIRVMKKATMRELLKRSPDAADSLILTFNDIGIQDFQITTTRSNAIDFQSHYANDY